VVRRLVSSTPPTTLVEPPLATTIHRYMQASLPGTPARYSPAVRHTSTRIDAIVPCEKTNGATQTVVRAVSSPQRRCLPQ
jgi:hypothetical protein